MILLPPDNTPLITEWRFFAAAIIFWVVQIPLGTNRVLHFVKHVGATLAPIYTLIELAIIQPHFFDDKLLIFIFLVYTVGTFTGVLVHKLAPYTSGTSAHVYEPHLVFSLFLLTLYILHNIEDKGLRFFFFVTHTVFVYYDFFTQVTGSRANTSDSDDVGIPVNYRLTPPLAGLVIFIYYVYSENKWAEVLFVTSHLVYSVLIIVTTQLQCNRLVVHHLLILINNKLPGFEQKSINVGKFNVTVRSVSYMHAYKNLSRLNWKIEIKNNNEVQESYKTFYGKHYNRSGCIAMTDCGIFIHFDDGTNWTLTNVNFMHSESFYKAETDDNGFLTLISDELFEYIVEAKEKKHLLKRTSIRDYLL